MLKVAFGTAVFLVSAVFLALFMTAFTWAGEHVLELIAAALQSVMEYEHDYQVRWAAIQVALCLAGGGVVAWRWFQETK